MIIIDFLITWIAMTIAFHLGRASYQHNWLGMNPPTQESRTTPWPPPKNLT